MEEPLRRLCVSKDMILECNSQRVSSVVKRKRFNSIPITLVERRPFSFPGGMSASPAFALAVIEYC